MFATLPFDAGVPTVPSRLRGVDVLVVQGDADTLIPTELQRRTWSYLHGDSGASVTSLRTSGGHGIGPDAAAALADWLTTLKSSPGLSQ
jgi:phospholipase/carboxylesterase